LDVQNVFPLSHIVLRSSSFVAYCSPFFATKSHIVLRTSLRNIEFADTTSSIFVIQRVQTKIALARAPSISLARARTVSLSCTTDGVCLCVCVCCNNASFFNCVASSGSIASGTKKLITSLDRVGSKRTKGLIRMDSDDDAPLIAKAPRLQNTAQTAKSTAREK
jgi:hypothetical protein